MTAQYEADGNGASPPSLVPALYQALVPAPSSDALACEYANRVLAVRALEENRPDSRQVVALEGHDTSLQLTLVFDDGSRETLVGEWAIAIGRRRLSAPAVDLSGRAPLRVLGMLFREIRLAKNISQEKFADDADLDRTFVGAVERGDRNVGFLKLRQLLMGLGLTWEQYGRAMHRVDSLIQRLRSPRRPAGTAQRPEMRLRIQLSDHVTPEERSVAFRTACDLHRENIAAAIERFGVSYNHCILVIQGTRRGSLELMNDIADYMGFPLEQVWPEFNWQGVADEDEVNLITDQEGAGP